MIPHKSVLFSKHLKWRVLPIMLNFFLVILPENTSCNQYVESIVNSPSNILFVFFRVYSFWFEFMEALLALLLQFLNKLGCHILIGCCSTVNDHIPDLDGEVFETSGRSRHLVHSRVFSMSWRVSVIWVFLRCMKLMLSLPLRMRVFAEGYRVHAKPFLPTVEASWRPRRCHRNVIPLRSDHRRSKGLIRVKIVTRPLEFLVVKVLKALQVPGGMERHVRWSVSIIVHL